MRMTGRGILAATLLISSLAIGACARPGPGPLGPAPSEMPQWDLGMAPSEVAAVRESADQTTLSIDLKLPANLPGHDCSRNLAGRVLDFATNSTLITITADLWTDPRCYDTTTVETVSVRLPEPLGARTVTVNNSSLGDYVADPVGNVTLRYCSNFRCAPPPPATCDETSVRAAMTGTEVDPHATWTVRGCDGQWLVVDFRWTGGPVCDNACPSTSARTVRWFYRATEHGWRTIVSTTAAGCGPVQRVEPAFPTALCQGLEPR